jgi:hypothetical protein
MVKLSCGPTPVWAAHSNSAAGPASGILRWVRLQLQSRCCVHFFCDNRFQHTGVSSKNDHFSALRIFDLIWLVVLTILKNMSSSMGRIIPYMIEKHVSKHQPVFIVSSKTHAFEILMSKLSVCHQACNHEHGPNLSPWASLVSLVSAHFCLLCRLFCRKLSPQN